MRKRNINWVLLLLTSLLMSVIICLLMPLSMYDSNPSEFPMTAYSEVLFFSGVFAVIVTTFIFLFLVMVGRFFPKALLLIVGLILGFAIALYAQGNLIGADYGALDGHIIQWNAMRATAVSNTLVWLLCALTPVLAAAFFKRFSEKCFKYLVPISLAYVALLSAMLVIVNVPAFERKKLVGFTYDKFMDISSEKNLVVIILDSFDRAVFDRLLKDDPTWRKRFAGFTYYHNSVSAFCYTSLALPQIVSGYGKPETELDIWQYHRKAYRDAPFLKLAKGLDFHVDAYYDETVCPLSEEFDEFGFFGNAIENAPKFVSVENVKHYFSLYFCAMFRYLPHITKRWWCEHQDKFKERFYFDANSMFSTTVEQNLKKRLMGGAFTLVPEKKVKIYHCSSLHIPTFNLEKAGEDMEMVCSFLDRVREAGVYDKTDFFIMADHGSINRCRPLFMCSNGLDEFRISEMPFSYRHLFEVFANALNGQTLQPIEANATEKVPIIDDPKRAKIDPADEKVFDGIGTVFSEYGLELIATTAEMDVRVTNDIVKMTWNGKDAIIGVPVEKELRESKLSLSLTFDRQIKEGIKFAIQYAGSELQEVCCAMTAKEDATDVIINLPDIPKNIDKRIVKLHFRKWEGDSQAPSIVKVAIGSRQ